MEISKGIRIATAAAAMLAGMAAGCGSDDSTEMKSQGIICQGGNACKGMGECKADGKNTCMGMGKCAGMGFVTAKDQADCDAKKAVAAKEAAKMAAKP